MAETKFDAVAGTLNDQIGSLSDLETTTKTNVVSAVNELNDQLSQKKIFSNLASPTLTTATSFTMPFDGFLFAFRGDSSSSATAHLIVNNKQVTYADTFGGRICFFCGFVKKGTYFRNPNDAGAFKFAAFPLIA